MGLLVEISAWVNGMERRPTYKDRRISSHPTLLFEHLDVVQRRFGSNAFVSIDGGAKRKKNGEEIA